MASSSKSTANVSSSSLLLLKADIAKHKEEFDKRRATTGSYKASEFKRPAKVNHSSSMLSHFLPAHRTAVHNLGSRPEQKVSQWAKQNKGLSARNARDIELEAVSKPTLENARAALERKAKIYEKLRKGKTGGLSEKQFDNLLVDFDQYGDDDHYPSGSESDEEDESATVPQGPSSTDTSDSMVEYEDEFGRMRTARKSQVPRHLVKRPEEEIGSNPQEDEFDPNVIYGDQHHFPVFVPDEDRVAQIEADYIEASKDPTKHYDASRENRTTGAGFYQFSADEETRARQMEELKRAREETEKGRREADVGPSDSDYAQGKGKGREVGASDGPAPVAKIVGRGMDKRKRELEERRKALDAKRRKTATGGGVPSHDQASTADVQTAGAAVSSRTSASPLTLPPAKEPPLRDAKASKSEAADDFLAQLEADLR